MVLLENTVLDQQTAPDGLLALLARKTAPDGLLALPDAFLEAQENIVPHGVL
jgi:hypothetical protein